MASPEKDDEETKARVPWWLWLCSFLWLVIASSIAWFVFWPNLTTQNPPTGLKPNEFGDLLAGIFSPLAFGWFVYAVFMQREELALQRKELKDNRKVLQEQSNAQKDSAASADHLSRLTHKNIELNQIQSSNQIFDSLVENFISITETMNGIKITFKNGGRKSIIFKYTSGNRVDGRSISDAIKSITSEIAINNNINEDENFDRFELLMNLIYHIKQYTEEPLGTQFNKAKFDALEFHLILSAYEDLRIEIERKRTLSDEVV